MSPCRSRWVELSLRIEKFLPSLLMRTTAVWSRHFCVVRTSVGLTKFIRQPFDCAAPVIS